MEQTKVTAHFHARVPQPSAFLNTGFVSFPFGTAQATESWLEADFLKLLSFDSTVKDVQTQPVTLEWTDEARVRRKYTPDVLVRYDRSRSGERLDDGRHELIEIKHSALYKKQRSKIGPSFKVANRWARDMGWTFRVVTEKDVPPQMLSNAKFLARYRNITKVFKPPRPDSLLEMRRALKSLGQATPATLLEALTSDLGEKEKLIPFLWHLLAIRDVGFDLTARLSMKASIWTLDEYKWLPGGEFERRG